MPRGARSWRARAHRRRAKQVRASGHTAGNAMRRGTQTKCYRDRVLMPALSPSAQALLRSQAGPQAGMWLTAVPAEAATTLPPQAMLVALRCRLRLALPLNRCGPNPGCGGGRLWRRRACVSKNGLVGQTCQGRGARLGPRGAGSRGAGRPSRATTVARPHDCPRRATTGPQTPGPRRVCGRSSRWRTVLRCDGGPLSQGRVTRSPAPSKLTGPPRKQAAYPELTRGGPQTLLVLGSEIGGRWRAGAQLCPRPGLLAGPTRASRRQGHRSVRMGSTMVGRLISGGAARGCKAAPRPAAAQPCSDGGPTPGPRPGTLARTQGPADCRCRSQFAITPAPGVVGWDYCISCEGAVGLVIEFLSCRIPAPLIQTRITH